MQYEEAIAVIDQVAKTKVFEANKYKRFSTLTQLAIKAFKNKQYEFALNLKSQAILYRLEHGLWDSLGVIAALENQLDFYDFEDKAETAKETEA